MSTLFAGPIEKRVMSFVKTRIANAEKEYEASCRAADESLAEDIKQAEARCESRKTDVADKLVSTITDKFL